MQADPSPTSELPIPQVRVRQSFKNRYANSRISQREFSKIEPSKKYKKGPKPIEKESIYVVSSPRTLLQAVPRLRK